MLAEQKLKVVEAPDTFKMEWFRVVGKTRETADTYTLKLKPRRGDGLAYQPGQFVMLYSFGVGEVPISISGNSLNGKTIEQTIRAVGPVTKALVSADIGSMVGVRGPFGRGWPLKEAEGQDVVIVAGGIGLAPLRPAIQYILRNREKYSNFYILYGARTPGDLLYKRSLPAWRGRLDAQVLVTVDRGDEKWRGYIGVVTTLFRHVKLEPSNTYAYVCGPEIMMKFTVQELKNQGLPDDRIFISMERNMKCGVGLCGHCQFGPTFVCKDGPVFSFAEVSNFFGRREV
ncbi:MAG: FAD/NAD(P)-binding protein [Nitrososphaerota archaeon]|nr:FAD/NAD(P)-binding protein [Candidatus Calditenuaceae archaeon]MDW8073609.1 FAD/NAD(P)-binding protein [Nitrososphaerota archaeon]